MKQLITIILLTICVSFLNEGKSQSAFGYLGKRVYVKGNLSASPILFGRNLEGQFVFLRFNTIATLEADFVLNKKNVLGLNYKRYSSIASIGSTSLPGFEDPIENSPTVNYYRFTTNEFGFNYQFFNKNIDAPLGVYLSLGGGIAISKFNTPIQGKSTYQQTDYIGTPTTRQVFSFDNSKSFTSPIIRFGIGKQTVFWNRFIYDVGVDVGLNLGFATNGLVLPLINDTQNEIRTQEDFDRAVRNGIQRRIFFTNLVNFRMGIAMLIF